LILKDWLSRITACSEEYGKQLAVLETADKGIKKSPGLKAVFGLYSGTV